MQNLLDIFLAFAHTVYWIGSNEEDVWIKNVQFPSYLLTRQLQWKNYW